MLISYNYFIFVSCWIKNYENTNIALIHCDCESHTFKVNYMESVID